MQRYNNTQSPFDPYTGEQLSYTRYTGLRHRDFYYGRPMNRQEIKRAIFFGALVVVGLILAGLTK